MTQLLHKLTLGAEPDVVHVRRVTRRLAQLLGFDHRDEVKITAAVSELTRAGAAPGVGELEIAFVVSDAARGPCLVIEVAGTRVVEAAAQRGTPAAESVVAAERLLERLDRAAVGALRFAKALPDRSELTRKRVADVRAALKHLDPDRADLSREELLLQGRELAATLLDLEERKDELTTLNAELGDTNRGVMALYAELDERATHLRRAGEIKTRFFSQMSHEFRTPLNSILALSNMLLEESDGPLVAEQRRQVSLIRDGVADLLDLVGDLLDLAKMEAGKTPLSVTAFSVGTLFGALRAMMRPLLGTDAVALEFADAADLPALVTDEAKVTQILRNFLSNAVKFTESGTIRVSARVVAAGERAGDVVHAGDSVLFAVADTGIGIGSEHHGAIFEEFQQVENRLQRRSRGTGLGLPLCRRLAGLLGGSVWVESELGRGATFYLLVPVVHHDARATERVTHVRPRLLIVAERADRRAALSAVFRDTPFAPFETAGADLTAATLAALQPMAAIVDSSNTGSEVFDTLHAAAVPLVPVADVDVAADREQLAAKVYRAALRGSSRRTLIVDDDEAYRTILSKQLAPFCERVSATGDARAGMVAASNGEVDCLVLDLIMPDADGLELLQRLRANAATARLPVVLCSSKTLSAEEHRLVRELRAPFLPKDRLATAQVATALLEARQLAGAFTRDLSESAA